MGSTVIRRTHALEMVLQQWKGSNARKQKEEVATQRSTNENPFGPWMLPTHIRRRQEIMQKRMQHRARVSDPNWAMNAQIEQQQGSGRVNKSEQNQSAEVRRSTRANPVARERLQYNTKVAFLEEDTDMGLRGSHSKFAVLSDITEEEEVIHSIETLKQKIKDLPGPSNTHGPVHEKKQGKLGQQNSSSGRSKNQGKGNGMKKQGNTRTEAQVYLATKTGPLTDIEDSRLNTMKQNGSRTGPEVKGAWVASKGAQGGDKPWKEGLSVRPTTELEMEIEPQGAVQIQEQVNVDPLIEESTTGDGEIDRGGTPMEVSRHSL